MRKPTRILSILLLAYFLIYPVHSYALPPELPAGEVMVTGSAVFDRVTPGVLNINVGADQNIANWGSYNVGAGGVVNYNRGSAFTFLNKVTGGSPSNIFGSINAPNGKIFLINQNGILFAPGSSVNAAGLVASTLDITNADFLAGNYIFSGRGGSVANGGNIFTPGGYVALLGSSVENSGIIEANLGKVILASGEKITLGLDPLDIISVVIDDVTSDRVGPVNNSGRITANGGKIILTAKVVSRLFANAVNNTGIIEARNLVIDENGNVSLLDPAEITTSTNSVKEEYWRGEAKYYGLTTKTTIGAAGAVSYSHTDDSHTDDINFIYIDPRIYKIYDPMFRTSIIDRQTPTGAYFYHPLTLSDSSSFDEISLDAGAYDFIDGEIGLKGDNAFSPFYQNDSGKKKNKKKG